MDNEKKYFFHIEDLVCELHLLIEENQICLDRISYKLIDEYGKLLSREAEKIGYKIILSLSREKTSNFLYNNSGIYEEDRRRAGYIKIISYYTTNNLIERFRGLYPIDLLLLIDSKDFQKKATDLICKIEKQELHNNRNLSYYELILNIINERLNILFENYSVQEYVRLSGIKETLSNKFSRKHQLTKKRGK